MKEKEFGVYVHIPFCAQKCSYCDFLSSSAPAAVRECYVQALTKEICLTEERTKGTVKTIFFGGGTPSVLTAEQMRTLLEALRTNFTVQPQAEISMEVNPGVLRPETLIAYRQAGINRLSIGLQSADNAELRALGRIHSYEQFAENYRLARQAGFANINVDLMLAIPGQTKASLCRSLERVTALRPEHLSVYSLILEEGTPFYERQDTLNLPDEETEREMYWLADRYLAANGYQAYEISNYALPGRECRHNLIYWSDEDYIGLGIGAASYWEGVRYQNTEDIGAYLKDSCPQQIRQITEERNEQRHLEEYLFLGLRKRAGIELAELNRRFDRPLERLYAQEMKSWTEQGLLRIENGFLRLTKRGIDVSNRVFAELIRTE